MFFTDQQADILAWPIFCIVQPNLIRLCLISTQPDPTQPNQWVNPTHGQLWDKSLVSIGKCWSATASAVYRRRSRLDRARYRWASSRRSKHSPVSAYRRQTTFVRPSATSEGSRWDRTRASESGSELRSQVNRVRSQKQIRVCVRIRVRTGLPSLSPIPVTSPNLCSNPGSNWTPKSAKSDSRKKSESISESLSESGSESGSELDSQVPPSPIPETSPNLCLYPVRSPKSPESEPRRANVVAGRYGLAS